MNDDGLIMLIFVLVFFGLLFLIEAVADLAGRRRHRRQYPTRPSPGRHRSVSLPAPSRRDVAHLKAYEQIERAAEGRQKLFAGPFATADEYLAAIGWDDHAAPGWERGSRA